MKLLPCPLNGPRNVDEFECLGPERPEPPPDAGDRDWAAYLFRAENRAGTVTEWWRHVPSNTVFLAERHTVTDTITRTWLPGADG